MDDLDEKIFFASDDPLDAKEEVLICLANRIDGLVRNLTSKSDRTEINAIQVEVAMLYHLSLYFGNGITRPTDVMLWRHDALSFFDAENEARGDHHSDIAAWRTEIEANFDRLIALLNI